MSNSYTKLVPAIILAVIGGGFFYLRDSNIVGKAVGDGSLSNDTYRSYQWHMTRLGVPNVGADAQGGGIIVAVLDTGIDLDHSHFGPDQNSDGVADRILFSKDFTNENDNSANDTNGHGTHVAGIIGSGSMTLEGIAPECSLIGLQVLSASGRGTYKGIENALKWCVENALKFNISVVIFFYSSNRII